MKTTRARDPRRWHQVGLAASAVVLAAALAGCSLSSTPATTTTTSSTTTTIAPPANLGSYLPLYPFATAADVSAWQSQFASSQVAAWHLSSGATAVQFAKWLGFGDVDRAIRIVATSTDAHVTVGFLVPGTTSTFVRAAVVHLIRWGTGPRAPWEAVGTDDTSLTLTTPAYGATVSSPTSVGGTISGVDENLKVRAKDLFTSGDIGTSCCSAAGGQGEPWTMSLAFSAPTGTVVTIVVQTGGHVAEVERFAVTGIKAGA